jgi:hypothetical protein
MTMNTDNGNPDLFSCRAIRHNKQRHAMKYPLLYAFAGLVVGLISHFAYSLHATLGIGYPYTLVPAEHSSLIARALIGLVFGWGFGMIGKALGWYRNSDEVCGIAVSAILALVPLYLYNQFFI